MPSPFPGMDPYLESPTHWSDFHARYINELANAINDRLPDSYIARIGEHVMTVAPTFREEGEDDPEFYPDVAVLALSRSDSTQTGTPLGSTDQASGGVLVPVKLRNISFKDEYTETFVQVMRLPEMKVVTVIELLSPTNKYGEGRGIYMQKRRELLGQPVNLVEFDLLRAGGRIQLADPVPSGHYHSICVPDRKPSDHGSLQLVNPRPVARDTHSASSVGWIFAAGLGIFILESL